jgi:MFS family permease
VVTLIRVESRRFQPLLEVRFFRSFPFSGASVIAVLAFGVLGGFLFLNTLYLQDTRGFSALHAGLLTLPMAVLIFVFAPVSGRLVGSRGPRLPLVLAGLAIMAAALLLVPLSDHTSVWWLLLAYVIFGLGFGLVNAPISNTAVSGMPNSQAGVAASVASASRQAGSALGVAITGSLVAGASNAGLAAASHAAWALLAACGLGIVVLGWASTSSRAQASAQRVRDMLDGETGGPAGPAGSAGSGSGSDREGESHGAAVEGS